MPFSLHERTSISIHLNCAGCKPLGSACETSQSLRKSPRWICSYRRSYLQHSSVDDLVWSSRDDRSNRCSSTLRWYLLHDNLHLWAWYDPLLEWLRLHNLRICHSAYPKVPSLFPWLGGGYHIVCIYHQNHLTRRSQRFSSVGIRVMSGFSTLFQKIKHMWASCGQSWTKPSS